MFVYLIGDCSERECPFGLAWFDYPVRLCASRDLNILNLYIDRPLTTTPTLTTLNAPTWESATARSGNACVETASTAEHASSWRARMRKQVSRHGWRQSQSQSQELTRMFMSGSKFTLNGNQLECTGHGRCMSMSELALWSLDNGKWCAERVFGLTCTCRGCDELHLRRRS